MSKIFVLLLMVYFHIIDDYCLQGILAKMKQKTWWSNQGYDGIYKYDYIWSLFMHSVSWSFSIMLPIFIFYHFYIANLTLFMFVLNILCHMYVDDLKCNKMKINLITDQCIHLLQILITYMILVF